MRALISLGLLCLASMFADASPLTASQIEQHLRAAQTESPSYKDIPGDLTRSPSFTTLWKQPEQVAKHARSLLLSPKLKADDKLILVWALQNVRWQELFGLYEWAFECYTKGQLPSELVDAFIFPSSDWNIRLALRYQDPAVRKLLLRIQDSKLPQEQEWLKKYIPDVLSGKAADGINVARRDGQLPDRNRKD